MDAKTRRLSINLITLGTGVIVFGLWSFIRFALTVFVYNDGIVDLIPPELKPVIYSFLMVFAIIIFLLEFYIGFSARKDGKGKRKSIAYIIVTGFVVVTYITVDVFDIFRLFSNESGLVYAVSSVIIEITATICIAEMMISSIMLRSIRKKQKKEENK
ncbi:MAG: hypothetical protein K5639_03250 [Eubacterium sp.]|nr:hypothetical protein [Eubacterium sp.]